MALVMGLVACATTPTAAPVPKATVATPAAPTAAAAGPKVPAQRIAGASGLSSLCETLKDPDGLAISGAADTQERERERRQAAREQALETHYVVDVLADGFSFTGYSREETELRLSDRQFALAQGAVIDRPTPDDPIGFRMGEAAADKLLQMHSEGSITLRLVFAPQPSQMRPEVCLRQSGGRSIKLGAQVLAAYILGTSGAAMATYETDGFAQIMAHQTPVENPRVMLGKPLSADATPVPPVWEAAAAQLQAPLMACYEAALARQNTAQGTLIVAMAVQRDGRPKNPRMEMSTVTDANLIACCLEKLEATSWGPVSGPTPSGLSLPISFGPTP